MASKITEMRFITQYDYTVEAKQGFWLTELISSIKIFVMVLIRCYINRKSSTDNSRIKIRCLLLSALNDIRGDIFFPKNWL